MTRVRQAVEGGERLSVTTVLSGRDAGIKRYGTGDAHAAAVRETPETFVEHYAPAPVMMIFGAVDTAQALCRAAKQVGFRTIVSDARAKFARAERLPDADEIVVGWPAMAYELHPADEATYVVVLTHDARFDEPALGPALRSPAAYIGALGSRRAQDRRRERMLNAGYSEADLTRISGPLGLDIGAITDRLRALDDRDGLGPSTQAIVDEADRRDIPVIRLDDVRLVQLGWGVNALSRNVARHSLTNHHRIGA